MPATYEAAHAGVAIRAAHSLPPWAAPLACAVFETFGRGAGEQHFADLVATDRLFPSEWSKPQRRDRLLRMLDTPLEVDGRFLMTTESVQATKRYEKTRRVIVRAGTLAVASTAVQSVALPHEAVRTVGSGGTVPLSRFEDLLRRVVALESRALPSIGSAPVYTPPAPVTAAASALPAPATATPVLLTPAAPPPPVALAGPAPVIYPPSTQTAYRSDGEWVEPPITAHDKPLFDETSAKLPQVEAWLTWAAGLTNVARNCEGKILTDKLEFQELRDRCDRMFNRLEEITQKLGIRSGDLPCVRPSRTATQSWMYFHTCITGIFLRWQRALQPHLEQIELRRIEGDE